MKIDKELRVYGILALVLIIIIGYFVLEPHLKNQKVKNVEIAKSNISEAYSELDEEGRRNLKSMVFQFCVVGYHRDSCLHNYITCGEPCDEVLSPEAKKQMRQDYELLEKKMFGL